MKTLRAISICTVLIFLFGACENNLYNRPLGGSSGNPGKVVVTNIEPTPGGAVISYTLPKDPDLLYVVARYTEKGITREFKASYYTNKLEIEGLSREQDYQVELVAYNRGDKASESVMATIRPSTPPFLAVVRSMTGSATYGGIDISCENPSEASIAIGVLTQDHEGVWYERDTHYTSRTAPRFSVRGFGDGEREFKVFVRDKWENHSDTVSFSVSPIGETILDKSKFQEVTLKGDSNPTQHGGQLRYIWDGRALGDTEGQWGMHTGNTATGVPMYITFDLGVEATLSRFNLQCIMDDKHMFGDMSPRRYEVWGRRDQPSLVAVTDDGAFTHDWFKMGDVENIKPSGLPLGNLNDSDRAAARAGDELVFEYNKFSARYIRIRCVMNWNGNTNMCFSEVTFWATEIKDIVK